MRKASYKIPAAAGDASGGELAVFYFGPGQGGSVEANVQRWLGQFSGVKPSGITRADRSFGSLSGHLVEVDSGTYTDSMAAMRGESGAPRESYGLVGAIVETPQGPYFFKLTGPSKTVQAAKADLMTLLESIKVQ